MNTIKSFKILLSLILSSTFFIFSCSSENGDSLSKDKFADVLTDLYLADGMVESGGAEALIKKADVYAYIYSKHGISKEQFSTTVSNYMEDTEGFVNLNKEVTARLKAISDQVSPNTLSYGLNVHNLWNQKTTWSLPEDGSTTAIPFKIDPVGQGVYTFTAVVRVFPDDQSLNPKMTCKITYADNTSDIKSVEIEKNGVAVEKTIALVTNPTKQVVSISGWILDYSEDPKPRHAIVNNISIKFKK